MHHRVIPVVVLAITLVACGGVPAASSFGDGQYEGPVRHLLDQGLSGAALADASPTDMFHPAMLAVEQPREPWYVHEATFTSRMATRIPALCNWVVEVTGTAPDMAPYDSLHAELATYPATESDGLPLVLATVCGVLDPPGPDPGWQGEFTPEWYDDPPYPWD